MDTLSERLTAHLDQIRQQGLYKEEREILGRQGSHVDTNSGQALNFCANNYLGLAGDQRLVDAAKEALDRWGFGMSSVRFICGTQDQHSALEREIAQFLRMDVTPSCFRRVLMPTAEFSAPFWVPMTPSCLTSSTMRH